VGVEEMPMMGKKVLATAIATIKSKVDTRVRAKQVQDAIVLAAAVEKAAKEAAAAAKEAAAAAAAEAAVAAAALTEQQKVAGAAAAVAAAKAAVLAKKKKVAVAAAAAIKPVLPMPNADETEYDYLLNCTDPCFRYFDHFLDVHQLRYMTVAEVNAVPANAFEFPLTKDLEGATSTLAILCNASRNPPEAVSDMLNYLVQMGGALPTTDERKKMLTVLAEIHGDLATHLQANRHPEEIAREAAEEEAAKAAFEIAAKEAKDAKEAKAALELKKLLAKKKKKAAFNSWFSNEDMPDPEPLMTAEMMADL
jgi:hypothetical protein